MGVGARSEQWWRLIHFLARRFSVARQLTLQNVKKNYGQAKFFFSSPQNENNNPR